MQARVGESLWGPAQCMQVSTIWATCAGKHNGDDAPHAHHHPSTSQNVSHQLMCGSTFVRFQGGGVPWHVVWWQNRREYGSVCTHTWCGCYVNFISNVYLAFEHLPSWAIAQDERLNIEKHAISWSSGLYRVATLIQRQNSILRPCIRVYLHFASYPKSNGVHVCKL